MAAGHISNTRNEDLPKKKRKKKFEDKKSGTDDENRKPLPYTSLFRYATSLDKLLMVIGLLSALIHGAAMPFMLLILGRITDTFVEFASCSQNITSATDYTGNLTISNCSLDGNMTGVITESSQQLGERITPFAWYYVIVACTLMVTGFFQVFTLSLSSTRQVKCIRHMFFRSVMRQEMEWMESKEVGKLNVRLNDDVTKIGMAIGDRMAFFVNGVSAAVFGLAIGFATGWKLTLIVLAIVPVLGISIMLHRKYVTKWTAKEISAYGDAGALVYNVLRNIRTVVAYGAEEREVERYNEKLSDAEKQGVRKGILLGGFQGFIWCLLLSSYALALWYGSNLALDPNTDFTIGRLMTVLFAVLLAAFNTGNAFTNFDVFLVGRCAAAGVLRVIDRESKIDPLTTDGLTLKDVNGDLELCNVCFSYPQRLVQKILEDFNATFCPGQIYALTGPSGTGKSTIVKLIQRLYDPTSGGITLDGKNITDLNVRWYRRKIAVVQQETTLFATTISENIKLGSDDVSDDDVINATKAANAYEFIESLPEKFQTLVGVGGCQLSGGQKQRIAIARALVRKPKILLLDQACSALDTHSEAVVLENLIQNRSDRTTILVAHRQSTIKIADHVVEIKYQTNATEEAVKTIDETLHANNIYIAEGSENLSYVNEAFASNEHHADENKNKLKTSDKTNSNTLTDGEHRKKSMSSDGQSLNSTEISTEEDEVPPGTFRRVLKINMEEWYYIVFGCVGSLLNGTTQPAFAVLLSAVLGVHAMLDNSTKSDYINFYCALMAGLAGLSFVSHFLQFSMFAKSGEILTRKIRKMTFSSILKQEMSWFDKHDIESTSLPDRLAIDAGEIQGAAGAQVGFAVSVFTAVFLALFIALYSGWKLALLQIAFFPLVVGAHAAQSRILHSSNQRDQKKLEEAGKIFLETLSSFETVAQLGKEEHFASKYENTLLFISKNGKKSSLIQGAVYGFASSVIYFSYAATFRYGATLLGNDEINLENLFRVFFVIMCAGIQLGRSYRHMPDVGKAKKSANRIFKIIDRKPTIDVNAEAQTPNRFNGDIQLKSCEFTYSTRKECKVLRNLDIGVESGKTLALVGRSGCGKSTIVQLIQRFYDPDGGAVLIDGLDAKEYNLKYLRSKIGVVFQDPVLFEGTVYDNIVYGDCGKTLSFEEVEEAAKTANIHDFITGLEKGYQTEVGKGGNRFSRGEKQRIAIARSLVRNPAILLLDEATSSLDNENEAIVQEALDRARQGRTSIMIAHRLSTIRNANKIAVMSKGEIMESGTHDTLLEKRGLYFGMVNASATKS